MILIVMHANEPNFLINSDDAVSIKDDLYDDKRITTIEKERDVIFQPQEDFILIKDN